MQTRLTRHTYVELNNSLVHLLQYGSPNDSLFGTPSAESSSVRAYEFSTKSCNTTSNSFGSSRSTIIRPPRKLIVFVPGNPGILGIYHDFLAAMFRVLTNSEANKKHYQQPPLIVAIGHNNADHPDSIQYKTDERVLIKDQDLNFVEKSIAKKYRHEPHHMELQVLNKLIILRRILEANNCEGDCRIMFIGHSIGSYVILRLIQDKALASIHEGTVLIHPALENLALTEKGSKYNRLFNLRADLVLFSLAFLINNLLPRQAKSTLVKWICSAEFYQSASTTVIESIMQLVSHKTLNATVQMAKSELALVKNINAETMIKPHEPKLKLIFAIGDHWANASYIKELRNLYPNLHVEELPNKHAFVMEPTTVTSYAVKVGMFMQEFMDTIDKTAY